MRVCEPRWHGHHGPWGETRWNGMGKDVWMNVSFVLSILYTIFLGCYLVTLLLRGHKVDFTMLRHQLARLIQAN